MTEEGLEKEEEAKTEEQKTLRRELVESFPKFLVNVLIVIGIALFYWFVTPLFIFLNVFPLLSVTPLGTILTGYSLLRVGVLLVIIRFGIDAIMEFAKFAEALVGFIISRLPGMRSKDRDHARRIPLDLIYIIFILVIFVLVQPFLETFPIDVLRVPFNILAVAFVLFFVLSFIYDLAKAIQKSAKRRIDKFGKRVAQRFSSGEDEQATASTIHSNL